MKAFSLMLSVLCIVGSTSLAKPTPVVFWYSVEGKDYFEVRNCVPGSSAAFYSTIRGGVLLKSLKAGPDGKVVAMGTKEFRPAMVLNNGKGGSNHVVYTAPREFALAMPSVKGNGKAASIAWSGATISGDISFSILRSTDGISYQEVGTIASHGGDILTPYQYTEPWNGSAVLYKIAVKNTGSGIRYITQPMMLAGVSSISVFPTSVSESVYISIPAVTVRSFYSVVNSEGTKVAGGTLSSTQTQVIFSGFSSGSYIITVHSGAEEHVVKIVKL